MTLRIEGDRAYGRGAYDMKGSLAAILLAVEELARGPRLRGDIVVTAVADEEYGSLGTRRVLESLTADVAVVTEPTGLNVCIAHKGFAWIEIETEGRAAHGSRPALGVDAIALMGKVLVQLEKLNEDLPERPPHPLLGHASLHASLIQGGQELSSIPARCLLQVERRTLPGETKAGIELEIATVLSAVEARNDDFRGRARVFFWRDPFGTGAESFPVKELVVAAQRVLGRKVEIVGDTAWMDSALTAAAGIPTVVFGPGGSGAHGDEEWVSISEIGRCAQILIELANSICA